jgi:antitoxin component YwqK of YwqJK toxin-antitoxin module
MKHYLSLLLLHLFYLSNGQQVKFKLYRIDSCDSIPILSAYPYYYLKDSAGNEYPDHETLKSETPEILILPRPGFYKIYIWLEPEADLSPILITDSGTFSYTYKEGKTVMRLSGMHFFRKYWTCDTLSQGYQEDFYPNGKIRIRGNFLNGSPKDSVVTFYPNGAKRKSLMFLRKDSVLQVQEFDSLSNILRISLYRKDHRHLSDYHTVQFFENSKIMHTESNVSHVLKSKDYYIDGTLKTNQTEFKRIDYFTSGKIKTFWHWKRKGTKKYASGKKYSYSIYKTDYSESGDLINSTVYEYWDIWEKQPPLEINKCDWIVSLKNFSNGKLIFKIKDIDPSDFNFLF